MKAFTTHPRFTHGEFVFRDLTPADRGEVLAFTAGTWQDGDYIGYVYDDWLADEQGRFICAVHGPSGQVCAIDKLTMITPSDAWFEGLRVSPPFRGRGLATALQKYMVGEAARLGANAIRLITDTGNTPIHLAAYRDGFTMRGIARFAKWKADTGDQPSAAPGGTAPELELRMAAPAEAPQLYQNWLRSSAWRTGSLVHHSWSFAATSAVEWRTAAESGLLLVAENRPVEPGAMPPPAVLVRADTNHEDEPIWVFGAVSAIQQEWETLMRALKRHAARSGIVEVNGLLPDTGEVLRNLPSAGFSVEEYSLSIFELLLPA